MPKLKESTKRNNKNCNRNRRNFDGDSIQFYSIQNLLRKRLTKKLILTKLHSTTFFAPFMACRRANAKRAPAYAMLRVAEPPESNIWLRKIQTKNVRISLNLQPIFGSTVDHDKHPLPIQPFDTRPNY